MLRLIGAGLAGLLLSLGASLSNAQESQEPYIEVTGIGIAKSVPDMATINLTIVREADTAQKALRINSSAMKDVMDQLRARGVGEQDLQTSNFSINPRYVYPRADKDGVKKPEIVGYQVQNSLTIRILELKYLGEILDQTVSLGVNQGGQISFGNSNSTSIEMQARTLAVENAMTKANTLAEAAGVKLGGIRLMTEGTAQARPMNLMQAEMVLSRAADSMPVPIAAGENSYRSHVRMVFEIVQ